MNRDTWKGALDCQDFCIALIGDNNSGCVTVVRLSIGEELLHLLTQRSKPARKNLAVGALCEKESDRNTKTGIMVSQHQSEEICLMPKKQRKKKNVSRNSLQ